MPYHAPELVDVVAELARQVAAMRVELAHLRRGHANDHATELVQATAAAMAGRAFTAGELLARSLGADAVALRLQPLLAGRTVRSIGRMLAGAADKEVGGLVLRRVGEDRCGAIWCVSGSRKPA